MMTPQARLNGWAERIRSEGLRVTATRMEIYRTLLEIPGHPTAEEVYEHARRRMPGLSRATVYSTLQLLVRQGEAGTLRVPSEEALRFDSNPETHHHFYCSRCGRIEDVHSASLDRIPPPEGLGRVHTHTVTFIGVCSACEPAR